MTGSSPVLVTGASGYVGGRLLRVLTERGHRVRALSRRPDYLRARAPATVEVVAGDVLEPGGLDRALEGVGAAYYLIHSMDSDGDFREQDRLAAERFAAAAERAGVGRLVYLGGLGSAAELSPHLASRQEVGRILRESAVPTLELQASIILGSGSLSFEMIRSLVEHLPIMVTPRWVAQRAQPIGIEDVLAYLEAALDVPLGSSRVVQIGGPEQVSYRELMLEYAHQRGLRRRMISVPVLTPWLSSLWLGLITPLYARIGRKLVDSLRNETLVESDDAARLFPSVRPRSVRDSIARAIENEDQGFAETRWNDTFALGAGAVDRAAASGGVQPDGVQPDGVQSGGRRWGGQRSGLRRVDSRVATIPVPPRRAFAPIRRIGGDQGWYWGNWLWRIRGFLDLILGGVGNRRGRRDPEWVRVGDAVDFWRVEAVEDDRLLRLRAEMKLPGRAWLQFEVEPAGRGATIRQTAIFDPLGLPGLLYWYGIYPLHALVFRGMLAAIARAASAAPDHNSPT